MKNFLMAMMMAYFMSMGVAYAGDKIDVNTATAVELQSVKGIGVKTAASIVAYREAHGAFDSLDAITGVKGIGDKKLAKLRDALMVSQVKKD
ncbi:MAG: helix-hairpin-helix domain-containing protein [Mariprofundaceae bacterium]|nr:helix-hairpin-helix domain-containing protein [Mariprofundaceae bacterium]